jgi:rare lipoprotein A
VHYRLVSAVAATLLIGACASRTQPRVVPGATARPPSTSFVATAYCRGRVTKSGTAVHAGVIAADPAVLPLGSVVRITGLAAYDGTYTVLDTGPGIRGHRIDLYMADCSAARRFGRRTAEVTIRP